MAEERLHLGLDELEDFARGAAFLGTGGGGDPYIGRLLATEAIREYGSPRIIRPDELSDEAAVYPVAAMGAPTVLIEKLVGITEVELALTRLEEHMGRPADAVISAEIGGINSTVPIAVAARRGIPLVDGDGMGRAFPELQMTSFRIGDVACGPAVVANEHGQYIIIGAEDSKTVENVARQIVVLMGGSLAISCYPMSGSQVKRTALPGTLTAALAIGRAIRVGRSAGDPLPAMQAAIADSGKYGACIPLFDGKIVDVRRETTAGFAIGRCMISQLDGSSDDMEITFQNENLVARVGGELRAIVPDLICIIDRETAEPITTEHLRYGQRVNVLAVGAPEMLRSPEGLEVVGPAGFALEEAYQPVEALNP